MACEKEIWQKIGDSFIQQYYCHFDNTDRSGLSQLYSQDAFLTWEGLTFHGRGAICEKLTNLPFKRIKHVITVQDCQPTLDSSIIIMVVGQLQVDDDPALPFNEVFMLKCQNGMWGCANAVFRLALHNTAV